MAESFLDLIFRTKKEGDANKKVADELGGIKDKAKSAGGAFEMLTGSSLSAAGAFGLVAAGLKYSIGAAMESEAIQADLNATLASTKGAAGLTADEINRMATNLSNMSGIEGDSIVKAQAMMLTFTNIGKDVFPMASEAMVNMASKFGSVDQAAIQLGKALNDPIAGVGALRKVGVQLSDAQEKQIKDFMAVNNVAGAQKVILGELQVEFGGLGEAMGNTTQGSINKLQNSLGNLAETIGGKLTPYLKGAADTLNLLLTADETVKAALEEHNKAVLQTSASYEEYQKEMVRAAQVAGQNVDAQGQLYEWIVQGNSMIKVYTGSLEMKTRAEWENERANDALAQAEAARVASERAIVEETLKIPPTLEKAEQAIRREERAFYDTNTAALGYKSTLQLTGDEVNGLITKYGSLTEAQIYNQLATGMDRDAAIQLGIAMGILDPQIIAARDALDSLNQRYGPGARGTKEYADRAQELADAIAKLKDKSITITTYYNSYGQKSDNLTNPNGPGGPGQPNIPVPPDPWKNEHGEGEDAGPGYTWHWTGSSWVTKKKPGAGPGFAYGVSDFVVPPGYPSDSYPFWVQSGEHVTVTPPGKSAQSGNTIIFNTSINNGMDFETFKQNILRVFAK